MKFAGKWIELEKITLSVATQNPTDKYLVFSHMWMVAFSFKNMCYNLNKHRGKVPGKRPGRRGGSSKMGK